MTLCLPFLMFQGRAQEAIDQYMATFADAELLEMQYHPEGTEISEPAGDTQPSSGHTSSSQPSRAQSSDPQAQDDPSAEAVVEQAEEELAAAGLKSADLDAAAADAAAANDPAPEAEDPDLAEAETLHEEHVAEETEEDDDAAEPRGPELAEPELEAYGQPTGAGRGPKRRLVASAQLRIGGQVLMIQDSLITHDFGFTPASSIAVVVDSGDEFSTVVESLSTSGVFLMEPGGYDFAANFAWVQDRFGLSWQITQPHGTRSESEDTPLTSQAPSW